MKLSTRDKNLIVFVICAAIIVLAYTFGYQKITEANEEYEAANIKLEQQKAQLEEQLKKKDDYEENIITKTLEYNKLLSLYPEGINQENQFQFFLQLTNALNITDNDATFTVTKSAEIYDFPGINSYEEGYSGISSELSVNFKFTYDQYKAFLKYIETCENAPTTLMLPDGSAYDQEWPIHKTYLSSISIEEVDGVENEQVVTNLICHAKLRQLAVTSPDRIYLDPTIVNIPGYQPEISKDNIFEPNTGAPDLKDPTEKVVDRAKTSYDAKIEVEAGKSTMFTRGEAGKLEFAGTADKDLYITIEDSESSGLYFITYSFGKDAFTAEDKTGINYMRMPVMPQDEFDILVVSNARYATDAFKLKEDGSEGEKVAIRNSQDKLTVHIDNKTSKPINLVVLGEPETSLEGYSDKVKATTIDGLQYVVTDKKAENITVISQLDVDVKALDILNKEPQA